tara:strand:+ start:1777 stop:2355 length:579 start_codon:yes stop_codon:yes gene_type:complete
MWQPSEQKFAAKRLRIYISAALLAVLMMGCKGLDLTQNPAAVVPLSGAWHVDASASDDLRAFTRAPTERRRAKLSVREEIRRIGLGSGLAFVVQGFQVIDADQMIIEQSGDSMGVKYIPGTYRDVTWGDRERDIWRVQAGWQERDLVIYSTAKGLRVLERYQLVNPQRLRLDIEVQADGTNRKLTRFFDRKR